MIEIRRHHIGDAPRVRTDTLIALLLIVGAPTAFFLALNVRYMLVGPACEIGGARIALEIATFIGLGGAAAIGWHGWRRLGRDRRPIGEEAAEQARFIGAAAALGGALFLLASLALWLPSLFLSPCGRP